MLQINKGGSDPQIACCQKCYHLQQDPHATFAFIIFKQAFVGGGVWEKGGGNLARLNGISSVFKL